jgi:UDP-N-acetylmuramoylalanine--D-glutamate ligase
MVGADPLVRKSVVVLGLARQGTALARFLAQEGADVTVSDVHDEAALTTGLAQLEDLSVRFVLGKHPLSLLDGADLLCLSGGVPVDIPIVVEARRRGIPLSNDAQVFLEQCPAPVIGITGSAGKTTTTALLGEMCRSAGLRTWVGGNIGNPLIADLHDIEADDCVVMELSSFQLELMTTSPHVAAVLNITPNHLDRHGTMDAYISAKRAIVAYQGPGDYVVLGYDDDNARALGADAAARVLWFSGSTEVEQGAFLRRGELMLRLGDVGGFRGRGGDLTICRASDVQLRGHHNLENVLAASTLAAVAGVPVEVIRDVAATFAGVEHRLELVRELNGVQWFDDSIATAPERSLAALGSFDEPIVLLAGGRDKNLPWADLAREAVSRVRHLVTFGEAGPMIARLVGQELGSLGPARRGSLEGITSVDTLEEAVVVAARLARAGDVVLLSPGGTSFDAFRDFAERGDRFKELVRERLPLGVEAE